MNNPSVSVIIPTYDRATLIARTIENVLAQTHKNKEIIVVDDGSTGGTPRVLNGFGSHIRVVTQKNAGPAAARNRGVEIAQGEIIAFRDSDDLWTPSKLERQVGLPQSAGPAVLCCLTNARMHFTEKSDTTSFDLARIRPKLEEGIWNNVAEVLATTFVLFNQYAAFSADAFRRVGGFDESLLARRVSENRNVEPMKIVSRELKWKRQELAAARTAGTNVVGAPTVSRVLKRAQRYRKAIYRRLPWYPAMAVEPVGSEPPSFSVASEGKGRPS